MVVEELLLLWFRKQLDLAHGNCWDNSKFSQYCVCVRTLWQGDCDTNLSLTRLLKSKEKVEKSEEMLQIPMEGGVELITSLSLGTYMCFLK